MATNPSTRLRPIEIAVSLREAIVDLIYPKCCAGCGARGGWVCALCLADLALFAAPWCRRCGIPTSLGICGCHAVPDGVKTCRAAGPYEGWLRSAILTTKYGEEPARAAHLGELLARVLHNVDRGAVLCPVPLHEDRERQRGYNQSLLLAERAAQLLRIPNRPLLKRTRATARQVGLDAAERWANVAGAFAVDKHLLTTTPARHVVLVDDVFTTGATLGACALALREAGIERIDVATVARTL